LNDALDLLAYEAEHETDDDPDGPENEPPVRQSSVLDRARSAQAGVGHPSDEQPQAPDHGEQGGR
jgi:hypothetical protein